MKFIVDAQLPKSLCLLFHSFGDDCIHTLDLPERNATGDDRIMSVAMNDDRVVVTKDSDFLQTHILQNIPPKLLLVSTGNVSNRLLTELFRKNLELIKKHFQKSSLLELTKEELIVHE